MYTMNGLPMGNCLSPFLADLFLHQYETMIHVSPYKKYIVSWTRYVDDVLLLWGGTMESLHEFFGYVNNLHQKLKFTLEIEEDSRINFLDLTLQMEKQDLIFNIYHKGTNRDIIIPFNSPHCLQHRLAAFHYFFQRLVKVPLSKTNYKLEYDRIINLAMQNGYPGRIIEGIYKHVKKKQFRNMAYKTVPEKDKIRYITINYLPVPRLLKRIEVVFKKHDFRIAYMNYNVGRFLVNNNLDRIQQLQNSGVYRINCLQCKATYVGETGRQVQKRINEHKKDFIKSNIERHLKMYNHNLDEENVKVLHRTIKSRVQLTWEAYEIERCFRNPNVECLNDKIPSIYNPLYRHAL